MKELFGTALWTKYILQVGPGTGTASWIVMVQIMIGIFLPLATIYKLLKRKSIVENWICCLIPFVLLGTEAFMEMLIFGSFCSDGLDQVLMESMRRFLHHRQFFIESLTLCGLFLVCSFVFTWLKRRVEQTLVISLVLNQIVEYMMIGLVLWYSYDYLVHNGERFFDLSDAWMKWYIYGLWILLRQSAFYIFCLICYALFHERRPKFVYGDYKSSEDWFACYLSDNYRGLGIAVTAFGMVFAWVSWMLFEEGKELSTSFYAGCFTAVITAAIVLSGLAILFFSLFPQRLGSYGMIHTKKNAEQMVAQIYRELEQEKPLIKFTFGRGFLTKNFIVLYLPMRIYYIPFLISQEDRVQGDIRTGHMTDNVFCFSDGRRFRINNNDALTVRNHLHRQRTLQAFANKEL